MESTGSEQTVIKGIGGSPGICIGKAYIVDREGVDVIKRYKVDEAGAAQEINRFKNAVEKARQEHAAVIESLDDEFGSELNILEAHMVLYKDKMIYEKTVDTINNEKINAEWALKKVSRQARLRFKDVDDPYLKSRADDISQVAEKVMSHLTGVQDIRISEINKRVVLVAHDLSPADTSQIQLERVQGFVTDRGGKDSHTSIIAKSLRIPSVVGLGKATSCVANDDLIIVDGTGGRVIINPDEETLFQYEERKVSFERYHAGLERSSYLPAVTLDGEKYSLLSNIELVEEVVAAKDNGAEGIGLFRTEFLYLDLKRFPTEEELFIKYREVVELMAPAPVTIRTLDINGDKVNPSLYSMEEANPALGLRAVRFCLKNPQVFLTQIKAILRAASSGNVKLLIPMISCVSEIVEVRKIIDQAVNELETEQKEFNRDIPLGIMIEVPSAVIMAESLAEHVDFFSIGTNDLIQYSMAIDRRNRQVAHLYQPLEPAVIKMIRMTREAADKKGIKITMCGEMAGEPVNIPILMGLGIRELSMNPGSIPAVKHMIRNLDSKETKKDFEKAATMSSAREIHQMLHEKYKELLFFNGQE
ncbi:MAG: phosphoenolpyruvate--protein phosphotransferase [Desulfobacteraceae bacterium]